MKILLVDRDLQNLKAFAHHLKEREHQPLLATDLKEAIHHLHADSGIELIFSEINFPDGDGMRILQYLRDNLRFQHIPLVIWTARIDQEMLEQYQAEGVQDILLKPVDPETFFKRVQSVMEKTKLTVLVVEDDAILFRTLSNMIEREGYGLIRAESTTQAIEILTKQRISLIISETDRPDIAGWDLLVEVKDRFPQVPVILVTDSNRRNKLDPVSVGADDAMERPFTNLQVSRKLRNLLTRGRRNPKVGAAAKS